jgi:hypothetical protein
VSEELKRLEGKKIARVKVSRDRKTIVFDTNDGRMTWTAEGDCCSSSWFEHVDGIEDLIGEIVTAVEHADRYGYLEETSKSWDKDENELTRIYFVTIKSRKGRCSIEMRNSSNGYYGGSIEVTAP